MNTATFSVVLRVKNKQIQNQQQGDLRKPCLDGPGEMLKATGRAALTREHPERKRGFNYHPPHHLSKVRHILIQVFVVKRFHDRLLQIENSDNLIPVGQWTYGSTYPALHPAVNSPAGDMVLPCITVLKHFSLKSFLNFFFISHHHELTMSPPWHQTNC